MSTTEKSKSVNDSIAGKPEHTIGIAIAAFSVISVTIGAGMVSVPKAAYNSGIIWSL